MSDGATIFKQRQRVAWSSGNWDRMADLITSVGKVVLAAADLEPGMEVLDVGTGSGSNISIPAALMGARVTGSDLTPELFDDARRRAAEAGVDVDWVEADAEALPFGDDSFDRVFSTFGHMFAPRHAVAAAELARVCRPGGRIVTATWTPDGSTGAMFQTLGRHLPPPPEGVEPPVLWGSEEHAREMYEPLGLELEFSTGVVYLEFPSAAEQAAFFSENFGPIVMAKAALGDAFAALEADFAAMVDEWNEATDGTVRFPQEYLVTTARFAA
jgi:SAM-dependent methyltransferase